MSCRPWCWRTPSRRYEAIDYVNQNTLTTIPVYPPPYGRARLLTSGVQAPVTDSALRHGSLNRQTPCSSPFLWWSATFTRQQPRTQAVTVSLLWQMFRPLTVERPKALLPLVNVPMITYTLEWLVASGVEEVRLPRRPPYSCGSGQPPNREYGKHKSAAAHALHRSTLMAFSRLHFLPTMSSRCRNDVCGV